MKAALLLLSFLVCSLVSSGQFLLLPENGGISRVDIGHLDVSGKAITVEALITAEAAPNVANIVSKHTHPQDVNYVLRTGGFFVLTNRGGGVAKNPVILCPGKVYHVAGTYDGTAIRYFVNGVEVSSVPCTGNLNLNSTPAAIGNMASSTTTAEQYHGYLSEVRIWNVARTAAEISANMLDLPQPALQKGLLAYYKFNGSLVNVQGNPQWNGKPYSNGLKSGSNPYFKGSVDYSFCGGNSQLVQATPPVLPQPPPALQTTTAPAAIVPVKQPDVNTTLTAPAINNPVRNMARLPVASTSKPAIATSKPAVTTSKPAVTGRKPAVTGRKPAVTVNNAGAVALPGATAPAHLTTIQVWDFDGIDGDSIALKINGKPLGPKAILLDAFKKYGSPESTFSIDLPPGDTNALEIIALGEGTLPFATIGLLIADDHSSQRYFFKLHTGEGAVVRFVPKTGG